jgi:membrane protein DedA with SNARE-associated domain
MLHEIIDFIVNTVESLGYAGIFIMMFLESSFFPFPSEVVMIPAGYLTSTGDMNFFFVVLCGVGGSLAGALLNYYLAIKFGRKFLARWGKYLFVKEATLQRMEQFFDKHGDISIFSGRLIPVVRQYISLPAGLAKMNIWKFSVFTSLGASIWVIILATIGYFVGENQAMITQYLQTIIVSVLILLFVGGLYYIKRYKKRSQDC